MTYKSYLAITGIRTKPEEPSSAEKFEALDNEAGSDVFKDTTSVYRETDQALGTPVRKVLATVDFSDEAKLKAFQEKFLTAEGGKFAAYPTQRLGDFFSADIINVVRRMQNPTGNQFTVPVSSNLKDKFSEIFQGSITNEPASYRGTPGLSRFELDFNDGSPSYDQVLQLRTFMTLMESEYSIVTETKVTTGQITAEDIAREYGPDIATLYDFALEYTEKTFKSKVMLSEEFPKVDGPILNAYLHAKQGVAIDQPLKTDGFLAGVADGYGYDSHYLDSLLGVSSLENISEATLSYSFFERALKLNGKAMNAAEAALWDLDAAEITELETVLADFHNAIYVEFTIPINNADGTQVASIQVQSGYEPISGFKSTKTAFVIVAGTIPDQQAHLQFAFTQSTAEERFEQYLKLRGF